MSAAGLGEPVESRWKPAELEALLVEHGFDVLEHATEADLRTRYFEGRADGLAPVMPVRLVVAERRR